MAEIKRPNYFTSQFLVEKDFNDEQAYHLDSRRRHGRLLHTAGVAEGLDVTRFSATQVQVAAGTAVDNSGREIVLNDARTYTLATAGSSLDVYLTLSYQEAFDPADHYTQAGLDKFTRTTERPLLQDGTAVPPADGSVIVLARIRLNDKGAIDSNSIDTTVRTIGGAKVAPKSVTTTQLADGAVTLPKLAPEVQPMSVRGINAISVATDNTLRQITIGEGHSARTDNPHATTAAQVDAQGGANQLVAQINAGTGVIGRSRLESAVISGVVTFQNLAPGVEMFSNDIDPGFGAGALCVDLALDDVPSVNLTSSGDTNYARAVLFRSEINRSTGHFRIFATRNAGSPAATATVRWYAFKPQAGVDASIGIGITVAPPTANLVNNATQGLTATLTNTNTTGVAWSITEANGGSLSAASGASVTYTPPGLSGTYHVVATSTADPTRKFSVPVVVNADITVIMSALTATVFRGATFGLSANVVNTGTPGVTWSIQQGASGGSVVPTGGNAAAYTAPLVPGTYTVVATSAADGNKKGFCTITVPPVTIVITPDDSTVTANSSTVIRATITGTTDNRANWVSQSPVPSVSPALGPTTTFFAPGVGGTFGVTASAFADTTKTAATSIFVPNVKSPGTEGGGKFAQPILEKIAASPTPSSAKSAPTPNAKAEASATPSADAKPEADDKADADDKARAYVKPKKRANPKLPPEPGNG